MRALILAAALVACGPAAGEGESRQALVVGNAEYPAPEAALRNAVNDARSVGAALRRVGFQVEVLENADHAAMRHAIRAFEDRLRRDRGVSFVYFAGHGLQLAGRNYLMPVGAGVVSERDVPERTVDAGELVERLRATGARLSIIVLDACRDNPLYKPAFVMRGGSTAGLAQAKPASGSFIAFATEPGRVATDGAGSGGVYARYLVQYMSVPGLSLEQVFKRVREAVMAETRGAQVPVEFSMLTGDDFYFVAR